MPEEQDSRVDLRDRFLALQDKTTVGGADVKFRHGF
jgi:hypothetical protein